MSCDIQKDTCDQCGCSLEIGTVIGEDDCVFTFELTGTEEEVLATYTNYEAIAKEVDSSVKATYNDTVADNAVVRKGEFVFSCTAEKMIFQLKAHVI